MTPIPPNPQHIQTTLANVLRAAQELTEPGDVNREYVRGQAELIAAIKEERRESYP